MKSKGWVGQLMKAMYGTRGAPQSWQNLVRVVLERVGVVASCVVPSLFYHPKRDMRVCTHVDDLQCSGSKQNSLWFRDYLLSEF